MAILHLILAGNFHARSIPELADVIAKHSSWTNGKKFLMVPFGGAIRAIGDMEILRSTFVGNRARAFTIYAAGGIYVRGGALAADNGNFIAWLRFFSWRVDGQLMI